MAKFDVAKARDARRGSAALRDTRVAWDCVWLCLPVACGLCVCARGACVLCVRVRASAFVCFCLCVRAQLKEGLRAHIAAKARAGTTKPREQQQALERAMSHEPMRRDDCHLPIASDHWKEAHQNGKT